MAITPCADCVGSVLDNVYIGTRAYDEEVFLECRWCSLGYPLTAGDMEPYIETIIQHLQSSHPVHLWEHHHG